MKRLLASAAIMASMLAVAPAAAQPYQGYQNSQGYQNGWNSGDFWRGAPSDTWQRIDYLQQRIDRGRQDGSLNPREAYRAQTELRRIRQDAARMRRNGMLDPRYSANIQARLDDLSRNLRWARHNGTGYGNGYSSGYGVSGGADFTTTYDATRYYRDGPNYQERRLSAQDEVYRGSDGRYYCKRNDGTTGLIVGGAGGAVLGNVSDVRCR
jgi:hypothetical protein